MKIQTRGPSQSLPHTAKSIAPYLFLILWCWLAYWRGRVGLPTEDQGLLMWERVFNSSDYNFFWNMLSYNRTRFVNAGDAYLFRPGTHALIALGDIFFRENLLAAGITSLVFLSLCAIGVFYWLSQLTGRPFAFLLTLVLVTPFAASKIVLWRHISGYLFCPLLLAIGLAALHKKKFGGAAILFFLSSLFHEATPLALLVSALALVFFPKTENRRALLFTFLFPSLLFFFLSTIDFLYYQGWQSPFGAEASRPSAVGATLSNILYFIGITMIAHFLPTWVVIEKRADETSYWNFSQMPGGLAIFLGIAFILLCALIIKRRKTLALPQWLLPLSFFGVVVLSLVVGRAGPRGWEYLYRSPYYFFYTSWALTALLAIALRSEMKRVPRLVVSSALVVVALLSVFRLQNYFSPKYKSELLVAGLVGEISELLKANPTWCYSGSTDAYLHTFDPLIFYRQSCGVRSGEPVMASLDAHRRIVIKPVSKLTAPSVSLSLDREVNKTLDRALGRTSVVRFTKPSVDMTALYLGPVPFPSSSVLVNYESPDHFELLFLEQNRLFQTIWQDGKFEPAELVGFITQMNPSPLTLRKLGDQVWLWWGESIVGPLQRTATLQGGFGLVCASSDLCPSEARWESQHFHETVLVTSQTHIPESTPILIPTIH